MKREALLRELRRFARRNGMEIEVDRQGGKGSHYRVRMNGRVSTVQSGELTPFHVRRIKSQLGMDEPSADGENEE